MRNPLIFKWNVLFEKSSQIWIAFKPELHLQVYPCYSCREIFGSRNSFLDHVNRRGIVLQYKCDHCAMELKFYNPCSFLLHMRQHFSPLSGVINLDNLEVTSIPLGMAGLLPIPEVPLLFDVQDDNAPIQMNINTRFYSPAPESQGEKIINMVPNELLFFYSNNSRAVSLVLKQVSSNIPRCKFVLLDSNMLQQTRVLGYNTATNNNNNNSNASNNVAAAAVTTNQVVVSTSNNNNHNAVNGNGNGVVDLNIVKSEPITIDEHDLNASVTTKVESLSDASDRFDESNEQRSDNTEGDGLYNDHVTDERPCTECLKLMSAFALKDHFVESNKPNDESLTCKECMYIAPSKCSLKAHKRAHHFKKPYVCPECGLIFKTGALLAKHMDEICFHMEKQVRFRCSGKKCGKIFAQSATYSAHLMQHFMTVNQCSQCKGFYENEIEFMHHIKTHGPNTVTEAERVYFCNLCNDRFTHYKDHINSHVKNLENSTYVFVCKSCRCCYRSSVTYETHLLKCKPQRSSRTKPNDESLKITRVCTLCKAKTLVYGEDLTKVPKFCPRCGGSFVNPASPTPSPPQSSEPQPEGDELACILCNQKMCLEELKVHLDEKHCKFLNPVVVVDANESAFLPSETAAAAASQRTSQSPQEESSTPEKTPSLHSGDGAQAAASSAEKPKRKRPLTGAAAASHKKKIRLTLQHLNNSSSNSEPAPDSTAEIPQPFDGTYKCKLCAFTDASREQFHRHIKEHRDVSTAYQCMECGECFVVKPSLIKHLLFFHQIADTDAYFMKNVCYDEEALKELEDHMRLVPGEAPNPVPDDQCRVCRQTFADAQEVSKHFRVHGMAYLMRKVK